ncbi:hypothetical protein ACHAXN_010927 [Cyclotella atomus]
MTATNSYNNDEAHKQQRVKARWAILRRALLDSSSTGSIAANDVEDSYSMNSFHGFGVLNRAVVADEDNQYHSFAMTDEDGEYNIVKNSYTVNNQTIQFYTREVKKQSAQMKREALLSHRKHGVDNTGNVRVWDAESTLAGFLLDTIFDEGASGAVRLDDNLPVVRRSLRSVLLKNDNGRSSCNILELGAGQAGLAGLALVAAFSSCIVSQSSKMKQLNLTLTDGHSKCVKSNAICAQIMEECNTSNAHTINTQLLLWDSSQIGFDNCKPMYELIDLCLASDCVHFQEYHDGLFMTIARTLSVGGIAILCQPRRGSSLDNFMSLVNCVNGGLEGNSPLFEMFLLKDFHCKVTQMHNSLSESKALDASYSPNWHQPLLLCLRKLRNYDEEKDGSLARKCVQTYSPTTTQKVPKENNRLAPYNPTHVTAQSKALELLKLQSEDVLFDLGCGDGRLLVIALDNALENRFLLRCVGIEYDEALAEAARDNISRVVSRFEDGNATSRACIRWDDVLNEKNRGNLEAVAASAEDLTLLNDATAVFVYLLPDGLRKVKPLLAEAAKRRRRQRELNKCIPLLRVVSYMFSIPGWQPVTVDNSSKGGCALRYYEDVDLFESLA